jgi:HEAT repeat protein
MQMRQKHAAFLVFVAAGLFTGGLSRANVGAATDSPAVSPAQQALALLGVDRFGIPRTVPGLRKGLHHPNPLARRAAVTGLQFIGTAAEAEAVSVLLSDPDRSVREMAIRTLLFFARVQGSEKGALLLESLRPPAQRMFRQATNAWARMEAAALLAEVGDASEVATLLEALRDKQRQNRALQLMDSILSNSPENKGSRFAEWSAPLGDVLRDEASPRFSRSLAVIVLSKLKTAQATAVLEAAQNSVKDGVPRNKSLTAE